MKKLVSIVLSVLMLISISAAALPAFAAGTRSAVPVIYIRGRGTALYDNAGTPESKQIYPLTYPDDYIKTKAKEILPSLVKALLLEDWDEYCDLLYDAVAPLFEEITLDDGGNPRNDSGIEWEWPSQPLRDRASGGTYNIYDYVFRYDWRIDPIAAAGELNSYVQAVKAATGKEKVAIICRCYATDIVTAYLTVYGHGDVDTVELYNATVNGTVACGKMFSGKLTVNGDAVERYVNEALPDNLLNDLIKATVALFNRDYKLDLAAKYVESVYAKVKDNVVPRLLISTYATMPSYWSMIGDEDYEDAKALVFGKSEGRYDSLIEKLDNYHYNVQLKAYDTLRSCRADGVKVAIITKYGYQLAPVFEGYDDLTDNTLRLSDSSFSATCSKIDSVLSDEYIEAAIENGTYKYISPDRQADASTCLFPDSTWIIKYIDHKDFPECVNELLIEIVNFDGQMTVTDFEQYPQYLVYDSEKKAIAPMTEGNCGGEAERQGYLTLVWNFLKALFAYIKDYINKR